MGYHFTQWREIFTPQDNSPELSMWQRAVLWKNGGIPDVQDAEQANPPLYQAYAAICAERQIPTGKLYIIQSPEKTGGTYPLANITYVSQHLLEMKPEEVVFTLSHEASHRANGWKDTTARLGVALASIGGFIASSIGAARAARTHIDNPLTADLAALVATIGLAKVWKETHDVADAYYARHAMELPADRDAVIQTRNPEAALSALETFKLQRDTRRQRQEAGGIHIQGEHSLKRHHPTHDDRVLQVKELQKEIELSKAY